MDELIKENKEEGEGTAEIGISTEQNSLFEETPTGQTLGAILEEDEKNKKIKNLIALSVLLAGILAGSLFIDFIQLFLGSGYSERALRTTDIFESGDKTWVAFPDPVVTLRILSLSDEETAACPDCDPTEVLLWMKKFLPTLVVKKISIDSDEGVKMARDFNVESLPAFIFDSAVKKTDFYNQTGVDTIFEEKDNSMVLNKTLMGIPMGKFIKFPEITSEESVWGNAAGLKIIVFSDFQCPYSKSLFSSLKELMAEGYQDKIGIVLKNLPAPDVHPLANDAAQMAICAGEQGKFWETATLLFDRQISWDKATSNSIFTTYYRTLGLDATKMQDCLAQEKIQERIATDLQQATDFSLTGTPSGFVGEEVFGGTLEKEELKKSIDDQLQEAEPKN